MPTPIPNAARRRGICRICKANYVDDNSDLVACAMVWHLYERHRSMYKKIFQDDHYPLDPDPRTKKGRAKILGGVFDRSEPA
jgi:hypothetical protein